VPVKWTIARPSPDLTKTTVSQDVQLECRIILPLELEELIVAIPSLTWDRGICHQFAIDKNRIGGVLVGSCESSNAHASCKGRNEYADSLPCENIKATLVERSESFGFRFDNILFPSIARMPNHDTADSGRKARHSCERVTVTCAVSSRYSPGAINLHFSARRSI